MADKKIILTAEEREALVAEYRHLIDVERPDVIDKLAIARSQGDLSENADYDAARDRQAQIEGRITEIEGILNAAVSAESVSGAGYEIGKIGIGDLVTFRDEATNTIVTVKIVGNVGADPMAKPYPTISNESPIGKAILGKGAGARVRIEAIEPYEIEILETKRG